MLINVLEYDATYMVNSLRKTSVRIENLSSPSLQAPSILSIAYAPNHPHVRQLAKSCYQRNVNATTPPQCEYISTTRTARMPEKGRDLN